jgi:hypothetical protein
MSLVMEVKRHIAQVTALEVISVKSGVIKKKGQKNKKYKSRWFVLQRLQREAIDWSSETHASGLWQTEQDRLTGDGKILLGARILYFENEEACKKGESNAKGLIDLTRIEVGI